MIKNFRPGDRIVLTNHNDRPYDAPIGSKATVAPSKGPHFVYVIWDKGSHTQMDGGYDPSAFSFDQDFGVGDTVRTIDAPASDARQDALITFIKSIYPTNKIHQIRLLRAFTGLGLKAAKYLVEREDLDTTSLPAIMVPNIDSKVAYLGVVDPEDDGQVTICTTIENNDDAFVEVEQFAAQHPNNEVLMLVPVHKARATVSITPTGVLAR